MKQTAFFDETPYALVYTSWRLGETYCHYFHGKCVERKRGSISFQTSVSTYCTYFTASYSVMRRPNVVLWQNIVTNKSLSHFKALNGHLSAYFVVWTTSQENLLEWSTFGCSGNINIYFWKIRLKYKSKRHFINSITTKCIIQKDLQNKMYKKALVEV